MHFDSSEDQLLDVVLHASNTGVKTVSFKGLCLAAFISNNSTIFASTLTKRATHFEVQSRQLSVLTVHKIWQDSSINCLFTTPRKVCVRHVGFARIQSRQIYSGTLRVETSRCRISLPGKHANIAKLWDLFPKCASSTHLKSKSPAYIHM